MAALEPYLGVSGQAAAGAGAVNTGLGTALNQNDVTKAGLAYGTQTGIGNAQANGTLGQAASQASGIQSLISGLGSLASFIPSGGLSSIFSGFGGAGAAA